MTFLNIRKQFCHIKEDQDDKFSYENRRELKLFQRWNDNRLDSWSCPWLKGTFCYVARIHLSTWLERDCQIRVRCRRILCKDLVRLEERMPLPNIKQRIKAITHQNRRHLQGRGKKYRRPELHRAKTQVIQRPKKGSIYIPIAYHFYCIKKWK